MTAALLPRLLFAAAVCFLPTAQAALLDRVHLLPVVPDGGGAPGVEALEEQARPLAAEEVAVFRRTAEGPWKTFADDLVSFELPDDPLLRVDVITPEAPEPIVAIGGAVGNADRSYGRAYRLGVGPKRLPWLSIFVREAEEFDDGICLCGAIIFKKLLVADGTCLEFSLLHNGKVKKVQALGAKHRAIFMEWTHSVITQDAYARIGASLRLKPGGGATDAEWRTRLGTKQDISQIGWLELHDDATRVRQLLGEPRRVDGETWTYEHEETWPDGSRYRNSAKVTMKSDGLQQFTPDWRTSEPLAPIRGSPSWAFAFRDFPKGKKIPKADSALIVEKLVAASHDGNADDWSTWTAAAEMLIRRGMRDQRIIDAVQRTFLDPARTQFSGAWILQICGAKDRADLFARRADLLLAKTGRQDMDDDTELTNLIAHLGAKSDASKHIVRAALRHPNPSIRHTGMFRCEILPPDEERATILASLDDPDESVRRFAAIRLHRVAKVEDLDSLRGRAEKETGEAKEQITEVIATLERKIRYPCTEAGKETLAAHRRRFIVVCSAELRTPPF